MVSLKEFVTQPREGKKFICHCIEEIERKDLFDELCQFLTSFASLLAIAPT